MDSAKKDKKAGRAAFALAVVIAVVLAIGLALFLSQLVVGSLNVWLVIGVSALMAAVAGLNPETTVETLVLTVILGTLSVLVLLTAPLPPCWQQVLVAACSGICTSKLALGLYCNFFQLPVSYEDASGEPAETRSSESAPRRAPRQAPGEPPRERSEDSAPRPEEELPRPAMVDRSAPGVREFDTVQVVRLATLEREFGGTEPVARAPRVGDIAMVAHDWEPDDPAGTVIAEMTDEDGYTVWSADFDKDELVCIFRPE